MIKSLIILVLLVVCLAGAALSNPSQDSFVGFYADRAAQNQSGLTASFSKPAYEEYAKSFTYNSHIIYSTVTKNGSTVFTGAFSHWFTRDESLAKPEAALKSLLK